MISITISRRWLGTFAGCALAACFTYAPPASAAGATAAEIPQPPALSQRPTMQEESAELVRFRAGLCQTLVALDGVMLRAGTLEMIPARIQEVSGLSLAAIEALEPRLCGTMTMMAQAQKAGVDVMQLRSDVRMLEWLVRVHATVIRDVTEGTPRAPSQVTAQGPAAALVRAHEIILAKLRELVAAMVQGGPTAAEAQAFANFLRDVVLPHERAEDQGLRALAQSFQDNELSQATDVVRAEHAKLEEMISQFQSMLAGGQLGQARMTELVALARSIRDSIEMHLRREERGVLAGVLGRAAAPQLAALVSAHDAALGAWLRANGWQP